MQVKRFGWVKRPTSWQFAQAWRAQRANMVARFRDEANAASTAFVSAHTNQAMGMATLAAQASITRTQNEVNAARSQFSSVQSTVDRLV